MRPPVINREASRLQSHGGPYIIRSHDGVVRPLLPLRNTHAQQCEAHLKLIGVKPTLCWVWPKFDDIQTQLNTIQQQMAPAAPIPALSVLGGERSTDSWPPAGASASETRLWTCRSRRMHEFGPRRKPRVPQTHSHRRRGIRSSCCVRHFSGPMLGRSDRRSECAAKLPSE